MIKRFWFRLFHERKRLREFAHYVLAESWRGRDIDGGDAQNKAEDLGLIELRHCDPMMTVDGETEHYFPVWTR